METTEYNVTPKEINSTLKQYLLLKIELLCVYVPVALF